MPCGADRTLGDPFWEADAKAEAVLDKIDDKLEHVCGELQVIIFIELEDEVCDGDAEDASMEPEATELLSKTFGDLVS